MMIIPQLRKKKKVKKEWENINRHRGSNFYFIHLNVLALLTACETTAVQTVGTCCRSIRGSGRAWKLLASIVWHQLNLQKYIEQTSKLSSPLGLWLQHLWYPRTESHNSICLFTVAVFWDKHIWRRRTQYVFFLFCDNLKLTANQ